MLVEGSLREVTALSGLVRHGNSGGPVVNRSGQVEATVFAARIGSKAGYGVPAAPVRRALARAKGPVSHRQLLDRSSSTRAGRLYGATT